LNDEDWVAEVKPVAGVVADYKTRISTYYELNAGQVSAEVVVVGPNNKNAIETLMAKLSMGTALSIDFIRVENGPGDLFLVSKNSSDKRVCHMVYRNVVVSIDTLSNINVHNLAKYLFDIMSTALFVKDSVKFPEIRATISENKISRDKEFKLLIEVVADKTEVWKVALLNNNWPQNKISILDSSINEYKIKALELGAIQINFNVYNTKTLFSKVKQVHFNIVE